MSFAKNPNWGQSDVRLGGIPNITTSEPIYSQPNRLNLIGLGVV